MSDQVPLRSGWVLAVVLGAGLLGSCGGGAAGGGRAAAPRTLEIVGSDQFRYQPAEIRVKVHQQVAVRLRNAGVLVHDFVTRGQAVDGKLEAQPGQFATGTFTAAARPGTYEFYCAQPGHEQAGMNGTIVVE
jgi:plastocyanin